MSCASACADRRSTVPSSSPMGVQARTEHTGVAAVNLLTVKELGWIFRAQPQPDFGIDAQLEVTDASGFGTNLVVGVQIKSGTSHLHRVDGGWRYYPPARNLAYWLSGNLPVIVVFY